MMVLDNENFKVVEVLEDSFEIIKLLNIKKKNMLFVFELPESK